MSILNSVLALKSCITRRGEPRKPSRLGGGGGGFVLLRLVAVAVLVLGQEVEQEGVIVVELARLAAAGAVLRVQHGAQPRHAHGLEGLLGAQVAFNFHGRHGFVAKFESFLLDAFVGAEVYGGRGGGDGQIVRGGSAAQFRTNRISVSVIEGDIVVLASG